MATFDETTAMWQNKALRRQFEDETGCSMDKRFNYMVEYAAWNVKRLKAMTIDHEEDKK